VPPGAREAIERLKRAIDSKRGRQLCCLVHNIEKLAHRGYGSAGKKGAGGREGGLCRSLKLRECAAERRTSPAEDAMREQRTPIFNSHSLACREGGDAQSR